MSDLVSVGSPIQIVSKENHENTSNGFENDKNVIEKPQHIDKNGIINHKNTKPDDVKISNNIEKLKTNDSKPKSKHSFSRTSRHSSSQEKSSTHKSKDRNSSSHRSTSQENNDIIKKSSNSKDRKNSSHRHRSDSKDKKHKHDKKSNQSDRDKTPKRDRKNSRSDKKEKSSSLCKEPKSLNGNRSDDESNAGGSSKQKSNVHKNKSSTSDKSKSSSGHHKSSRKDNSSKDVVDKSKDKSSISKTSSRSSHKSNRTHSKKRKRSLTIDSTSPESNPSEEKKPKWSDFMTNDEQDAANVLLSMSEISYESSHSEIITENIIFIDNSSFTDDTLKTPSSTTGNILKNQDNFNQTKNIEFSDNKSEETNFNLKTSDMEPPKPSVESVDNINEKCIPPINRVAEEVCSVDAENPILFPCKDVATQNTSFDNLKITSEPNTQVELEVPKLKLKLSQNHVNFFNYEKRRKHHKNHKSKVKKLRLSCYSSNEVNVPVIDNVSTTINSEQNNQKSICDIDIKRNDSVIIPPNQETLSLPKDSEIKNTQPLENNESLYTFKGFSQSEAIPCKNYEKLRHLIITLKKSLTDENVKSIIDNDGFKGFTCEELHPCENRDLVNLQLNKLKDEVGFKGFSKKEILMSSGHKFIKQQLELSKKQNDTNNDQPSVTCGGNGIKNGKSFKEVMSIIYESNNDGSSTPKKICSKPVTVEKKSTVVNNNNHDITASNDWVVKQEMKYKLLPVKVKLERLMEYRYNGEDNTFKYYLHLQNIFFLLTTFTTLICIQFFRN